MADLTAASKQRLILINRFQQVKYCTNRVSTAKYNVVTFLPRFFFEQFRRYANIFFLVIALLQQIPDVSPTGRYTTAVPFMIILTVSAIKEIIEDWKRHRADRRVNHAKVLVLRCGHWVQERWEKIQVGDIVKVTGGQFFPADLVLLSSSEPQAMAYIETSNLDGETNLKIRKGLPQTAHLLSHDDVYSFTGSVECEAPNRHLYEFTGLVRPNNDNAVPLGPDQILLRGAQLKNTNWIFGIAIYTGHESKLMMNTNVAPLKRSNVDRVTNNQILALFCMLVAISLISAVAAQVWINQNQIESWYLGMFNIGAAAFGRNLLTFFILYNNLIPISLQVTLEIVRFFQAIFINMDKDMYYAPADQPAMARTSNLNEELGQVKYIFSDKTGTLTRNVMTFKRCSIAGVTYGSDEAEQFDDQNLLHNLTSRHVSAPIIREFLTLLSVCHTVVPEKDSDANRINYQASSPDEGALVKGAKELGFVFHTRTPNAVIVNVQGRDERYEVLNVLEFTSARKRMGVIVRTPNGKLKLFVKGADSAIYERLAPNQVYADVTLRHLEEFAQAGLRTLCIAKADIAEEVYEGWRKSFYDASIALQDREKKLEDAADSIETNLTLLGATAIEDKLQDGVPECIASLLKADIKIWMLTGDKQETAINIGYSCKLLSPNMPVLIVAKESYDETRDVLRHYIRDLGPNLGDENDVGLIITGRSLMHALNVDLRQEFLNLAISCRVVICCRVTPIQKAEVVELVKKSVGAITLAIGDGANDVAMIQAAHVGVGISGMEGLQAACASDYAIAQFRFLTKLLFVHGAWSFHRTVKLILYCFHKNVCLYIIELWFAIYSAWSGQTLFDRWTIGLYNVLFTAAPPFAIGLFDRTATADTMLKYPALYKLSQNRKAFNVKLFWLWIINSLYHSVLLFWLGKLTFGHDIVWSNGKDGGLYLLGNSVYSYVVLTVCLKAGLELDAWTWPSHVAIWGSIIAWFLFLFVYCNLWPHVRLGADMLGLDLMMYSSGIFWFGLLLIPLMTLLVDFVYKVVRRTLFKTIADEVRELELSRIDPSVVVPKLTKRRNSVTVHDIENEEARTYGSTPRNANARTSSGEDEYAVEYVLRQSGSGRRTANDNAVRIHSYSTDDIRYKAHKKHQRLSETARLLRNVFKRSASGVTITQDAQHGYAFSQEEHGVVSQSEVIRSYDSTKAKPEGM